MINTDENKKVLIVAAVCVGIIAVFWAFMYFPAAGRLKAAKAELNSLKREITDIESRAGKRSADIAQMVESMHREFERVNRQFPSEEEEAFRMITNAANKLKINMSYMRSQQKKPVLNSQGANVMIDGVPCCSIAISMEMTGLYGDLGEYLRWLREDFAPLITVDDLTITKDESRIPQLNAKMKLVLYVLGET